MRLLVIALLVVGSWALAIGFVWLGVRLAGGPHAWQLAVPVAFAGWIASWRL